MRGSQDRADCASNSLHPRAAERASSPVRQKRGVRADVHMMSTPTAVILATGAPTGEARTCPLDRASHLIPLANRPVLVHTLHAIRDAGLDRAVIVKFTRQFDLGA